MLVARFKTIENLWKHKKKVNDVGKLHHGPQLLLLHIPREELPKKRIKPITGEKPAVRTTFIANSPHSLLSMEINIQEVIGSK